MARDARTVGVLHSGHCLRDVASGRVAAATASTTVHFADVTEAEIDAYVATGEPLQVAGAFTIDGSAAPSSPGSRATTTTWSASACRCCASSSSSSDTRGRASGPPDPLASRRGERGAWRGAGTACRRPRRPLRRPRRAAADRRDRHHRGPHHRLGRARRRRRSPGEPGAPRRGPGRLLGGRHARRLLRPGPRLRDPHRRGARHPVRPAQRGRVLHRPRVAPARPLAGDLRLPRRVHGRRLLPLDRVPGVAGAQPQLLLRRRPADLALELVQAGEGGQQRAVRRAPAGHRLDVGRARRSPRPCSCSRCVSLHRLVRIGLPVPGTAG